MSEVVVPEPVPERSAFPVRRYTVRGRVQGVGFRWWTQREACARKLVGWVWNRADGAVGVVAGGDSSVLEAFAERLRKGPPGARVDSVEVEPVLSGSVAVPHSFEIVQQP